MTKLSDQENQKTLIKRLMMASGSANSFVRTGDGDELVLPLDIAIAAMGEAVSTDALGLAKEGGNAASSANSSEISVVDVAGLRNESNDGKSDE
jgi:hypothetical protein